MKKLLCAILLIIPGIAFFMDDFGTATLWLRIFGVCLILVVVADYVFKKNLIIPVCKFVYFFGWFPIVIFKLWRQRKKKKSDEFWRGFRPWY